MSETMEVKLQCSDCGEVMGSITGPSEGVERELKRHKEAKVKCSACQSPKGVGSSNTKKKTRGRK